MVGADGLILFVEALILTRQRPDLVPEIARTIERLHASGLIRNPPYARAREGVTRKQHFAERLNLVEQDRSTLRERYRK